MPWEEQFRDYTAFLKTRYNLTDEDLRNALETETIPIEAFANDLTPLQAAAHALAQRSKSTREIAHTLGRTTGEVEKFLSVKTSKLPNTGTHAIATKAFADRTLSASERLVAHLESRKLSVAEIAAILKKSEQTIWTLHYRIKKKQGDRT